MRLLRLMKLSTRPSPRACPFCSQKMWVVNSQEPLPELEACRLCNLVWFDEPSYESLPQLATENMSSIQLQATEIIAMDRLRELKEREEEERQKAKKKRKRLFEEKEEKQ